MTDNARASVRPADLMNQLDAARADLAAAREQLAAVEALLSNDHPLNDGYGNEFITFADLRAALDARP